MQKLKIAYFGSPSFSATFLEKIINDKNLPVEVKLVVTQPDMPVGRKQVLTPTSVKNIAQKYEIDVYDIPVGANFNSPGNNGRFKESPLQNRTTIRSQNLLRDLKKIDFCLVYAYGQILSKELLDLPKFGFWNVHPSLLPKYRGASPIAYPLILGDKITGVSLILMDEKMDHGPIIAQEELEINSEDARSELETKLTNLAFKTFKSVILNLFQDPNKMLKQVQHDIVPQDHSQATYAPYLKKSDGFIPLSILKKYLNNEPLKFTDLPLFLQIYIKKYSIDFSFLILNSKFLILNLFRGLSPWPGLWTLVKVGNVEKRLKIVRLTMKQYSNLTINSVQLEGKKEVDFNTFNKAYRIFEILP